MHNDHWKRVSKANPCQVCGRPDWCLFKGPEGDATAVICPRVESSKRAGDGGWLHVLRESDDKPIRREIRSTAAHENRKEFSGFARECIQAAETKGLYSLSESLGVSIESLKRLCTGWSIRHEAWTFPMHDMAPDTVGIRLRYPDGRKLSLRGGREGLFLPSGICYSSNLVISEGPTDTAALLDLGFSAVGRPSCTGGIKQTLQLVEKCKPTSVTIMADADEPGLRGAESLAVVLLAYSTDVRVVCPPNGIKDLRQWKQCGATSGDVQKLLDNTPVRKLRVLSRSR